MIRNKVFSLSKKRLHLKDKIDLSCNDGNYALGLESQNEDCIYVSDHSLICCDGVGSSEDPRKASYYLTSELLKIGGFFKINRSSLADALKRFDTYDFTQSSTTCMAAWTHYNKKKNILTIKLFQVGDGLCLLGVHHSDWSEIFNLKFSPEYFLDIDETPNRPIDLHVLTETNECKFNKIPPAQISPGGIIDHPFTFFNLNGEDYTTSFLSNLEDYHTYKGDKCIFYRKYEFKLEKECTGFTLMLGSDGAYDNLRMIDMYNYLYQQISFTQLIQQLIAISTCDEVQDIDSIDIDRLTFKVKDILQNKISYEMIKEISDAFDNVVVDFHKFRQEYTKFFDPSEIELISESKLDPELASSIRERIKLMNFMIKMIKTSKIDDIALGSIEMTF